MKTDNPNFPKGLMKATRYFSDQRICLELQDSRLFLVFGHGLAGRDKRLHVALVY
jgi:hypothetical protein